MMSGPYLDQVGWKRVGELGWMRLSECGATALWRGAAFLSKTPDVALNGRQDQYAMAVEIPGSETLAFMSDEGLLWAHGLDQLPKESNYNGAPYTLSAAWLRRNLSCLGKIGDPDDVWCARRVMFAPVSESRQH